MEMIKRRLREFRHSPCLMKPTSAILICLLSIAFFIILVCKLPILIIGLFIAPIYHRISWLVEFIYPAGVGRWAHLLAMRYSQRFTNQSNNNKYHSRCAETRIELLPGRLYIHPLPQFLDNLGYLVIIQPIVKTEQEQEHRIHVTNDTITGIIVDCGQANVVMDQIKFISNNFYSGQKINLLAILSTHKHHDHTAGNFELQKTVKWIVGGAIEQVPGCNLFLADQQQVPLDLNDISITAIAVPAHTRGSLTYSLEYKTETSSGVSLFTGDTIFSGGGGVAFEADMNHNVNAKKLTAHTYIQSTTTANAVERCFAQVLFRSSKYHRDDVLVFPGHEYSTELLSRQFNHSVNANQQSHHHPQPRWKTLPPADFFETAAAWYIADHRKQTARLLAVPSTIARELTINPHFRSMRLRGTHILHALRLWHWKFANNAVLEHTGAYKPSQELPTNRRRTESKQNQWNISVADIQRPVFTTVYSTELQQVIQELQNNTMDAKTAAERLVQLPESLNEDVIGRRPVPGTIPSGRAVYRGLLAFVLLGSPPTVLCSSDAIALKLDEPNDTDSEIIRISKTRLIAVLHSLGLLQDDDGAQLVAIIHQLWRDTIDYDFGTKEDKSRDEEHSRESDTVELGDLKWVLYGIPRRPRQSFGSYCLPCRRPVDDRPQPPHPACRMLRHSGTLHGRILICFLQFGLTKGELVRHDIFSCPLCRDATGNAAIQSEEVNGNTEKAVERTNGKRAPTLSTNDEEDEGSDDYFIEVAPLDASVLKEV